VERDEKNIVSHVSALARRRQDDDVFTRHVSDAGPERGWDVFGPHGSETLQLHPVRAHDGWVGPCKNSCHSHTGSGWSGVKSNMTPDQAANVIQNAWRLFDDTRKDRALDEYRAELWDTYYRECCTPGAWEFY